MAQTTIMVLKVDLGCERCYKKIKKLLCKIPEIQDQSFFEKDDTVIIKVVCCSPERIRSKLICKGGKIIKSIEIKVPEKPKPPPEKPKEAEKPKPPPEKPKEAEKPKPPPEKPKEAEKPKPPPEKPKEAEKPKPVQVPPPVTGFPPIYPFGFWCNPSCGGRCGGPCHHGCGIPHQPPSYDGYVRLVPSYDGWASACRCDRSYGCRCEENPACTIM